MFDEEHFEHLKQEVGRLELALSRALADLKVVSSEKLALSEHAKTLERQAGTMRPRLDLEGRRIAQGDHVWLIVDGLRRYISSPRVYSSLFGASDNSVTDVDVRTITEGTSLDEGTCLVRSKHEGVIYMLDVHGRASILRNIKNWETFQAFSFDINQVDSVSDSVLLPILRGRDIHID